MSERVCTLPFSYDETEERRILNLADDGLPCVPVLGYSNFKKSRPSVAEHLHPGCFEITLCMRGSLVFECEGSAWRLMPGNLFVTRPDEWHRLSTNPKGLVIYYIFFRPQSTNGPILNLPAAESRVLCQKLSSLPRRLFPDSGRLRQTFQRLYKLLDTIEAGALRTLCLRSSILELLLEMTEAAELEPADPADHRIEALVKIMQQAPEADYPLDFMLRQSALSESRLNVRFKQLTGFPPYAYLLSRRLARSQQLLAESNTPITSIAQQLRFSSSQHFAMHFKREFGCTPSAWRRQSDNSCQP